MNLFFQTDKVFVTVNILQTALSNRFASVIAGNVRRW